jgi:predicted DsbA family dithiol-disulfide isomerase
MSETPIITVDIVSDVVCPWCIIGYKKLEQAMTQFEGKARFELTWHAFELNPSMALHRNRATPIENACAVRAMASILNSTFMRICGW